MANVCVAIDSMTSFHPIYTRYGHDVGGIELGPDLQNILGFIITVIASLSKDRHKIVT